MVKAYSYIRFSTPEQAKGDSLRRQKALSEKYATENNLSLDTSLKLQDLGVSAFDRSNITKGALGNFLNLVKEGKIETGSYLLVESLDRLSRGAVSEALYVFLDIIRAGVVIVTLQDQKVYSTASLEEPMNLFSSLIIMQRASEESSTKSFRGKLSWEEKKRNINKKILTQRCPYWLKPSIEQDSFELIKERAAVVKNIFQMAKDGLGNEMITKRLNKSKTPTFSKITDGWQGSYIQKVFRSKAVYGDFEFVEKDANGNNQITIIENYFPKVISKEEWTLVNNLRKTRKTRGGVKKGKNLSNLFSGLFACGYCSGSMNMGGTVKKKANQKKITTKFIACSRARRGLGCKFCRWNYIELENEILKYSTSVDFSNALGDTSQISKDIEVAKKNEISIHIVYEKKKSKLSALLSNLETIQQKPETIINRINELENEIDNIENSLAEAKEKTLELETHLETHSSQQEAFEKVLEKLNSLTGDDLHDFRIKLSALIHQSIHSISLYPLGPLMTEEAINNLSKVKESFGKKEFEKYIQEQNKNATKANRFLTIIFQNGNCILASKGKVIKLEGTTGFKSYSRSSYDAILKNLD